MATVGRGGGVFSHRSRTADIVEDAVLLATGAVRIAVKNLLIVRALRERADFDERWWRSAVEREFEVLAAENEADATRLDVPGQDFGASRLIGGWPPRAEWRRSVL